MREHPTMPCSVLRRAGGLVAAGCAFAVLVGCAAAGPNVEPGLVSKGSAPSTSPVASSGLTVPAEGQSSVPSRPVGSEGDSMASSHAQAEVTVSGVIIEGLRSDCRILQTDQRRYALTGPGTAALQVGERVTVTGRPRPDLISPCGSVFVVTSQH